MNLPSQRTENAYRRAAARFDAELDRCGLAPTPENYVVVATADDPYLTDASWRFIRASIKWWISISQGNDKAEHFTRLFRDKRPDVKPKARLAKGVSKQLENDLITILRSGKNGRFKRLAADMLEAGIATGLRPIEWKDAELIDDVLHVTNAKFRPGISGNGNKRELILVDDCITADQRAAIDRVLSELNGVEWDEIGTHVRRALRGARNKLKKMSLISGKEMRTRIYDARHQFAADAKISLDYEGGEVAAAMGHRSAVTAHSSYGNRKKGRVGLPVKPSRVSVQNVDQPSLVRLSKSIGKAANRRVDNTVQNRVVNPIPIGDKDQTTSKAIPPRTLRPEP
jgi:integrase